MTKQTIEIDGPDGYKVGSSMSKQMIEIDVPDGYEVGSSIHLYTYRDTQDIRIFLKKKETESIWVRLCLVSIQGNAQVVAHEKPNPIPAGFVRFIDNDWKKVEI